MAAPSRPESATSPPAAPSPGAGDGTVVFSGPTLEGALAAARAAYGPRVRIVRAQRVRRGVRGLLGQVRYDVHARVPETSATVAGAAQPAAQSPGAAATSGRTAPRRPAAPAPPPARVAPDGGQDLADVLRHLVDAADESERSPGSEPSWSWNGEAEVGALLSDVAALGAAHAEASAGHPAPELARHTPAAAAPAGVWRDLLVGALEPVAVAPRPVAAPLAPAEPEPARWSRNDLRGIGVPPAVLRRLPVEDPVDDGGWRRALQEAIAAIVPAPSEPDADHPVVVSGHGLAGAIAVLRAAVEDGAVPGTISFQGRRRPATPAALVEVLATCAGS